MKITLLANSKKEILLYSDIAREHKLMTQMFRDGQKGRCAQVK